MRPRRYESLRAWGLRTLKPGTMFRISVVGMTVVLLIAVSTLAPGAPVIPQWPEFVLFPFIFVVHFSSVLRLTPTRGRFRWRDQFVGIPPIFVAAFFVLLIGAWLVGVSSITSIGGQPTVRGGHYFLNDHGALMPVSKTAYDHALVLQQRIFTLIPSVFFALGALIHYPGRSAPQISDPYPGPSPGGPRSGRPMFPSSHGGFADAPTTGQWSSAPTRRPSVRLAGLAVGGVAVVGLFGLSVHLNGSCSRAGISTAAGREGICTRYTSIFFGKTTYNVVDAGHVLHMPGYDAQLLITQVSETSVTDPQSDPQAYAGGKGQLVSFEISITNRGTQPLTFDTGGDDVSLLIDNEYQGDDMISFPDLPNAIGEPGQAIADESPIAPGQTVTGWVSFVAPTWATTVLNERASDLDFSSPGHQTSYVGQIRLWKAANAQGQSALTIA